MGWFSNFFENMRINESKKNKKDVYEVEDLSNKKVEAVVNQLMSSYKDSGLLWEMLGQLRNFDRDRPSFLGQLDEMERDSKVASILELYADDATQQDFDTKRAVWVEADSKDLQDELNAFLRNVVNIEKRIWGWAYRVSWHGEVFLRTFAETEEFERDGTLEKFYFEEVNDPKMIYALEYRGLNAGFIYKEEDQWNYYPPKSFIHIVSDSLHKRQTIKVPMMKGGKRNEERFTIKVGSSILSNASAIWRVMRVIEDALILARISRSSNFRVVHVEVGKMDNPETNAILNRIRRKFKASERINLNTSYYSSDANPITMNDFIFLPVSNGEGAITVQNVGGEVDIKDIADIEYFLKEFYGALKVPRTYMGFDDAFPGANGSPLSKSDLRYARSVKRVQACLKNGITDVLNFYLYCMGRPDEINQFDVVMTSINTAEEVDHIMDFEARVGISDRLLDLHDKSSGGGGMPGISRDGDGEDQPKRKVPISKDMLNNYIWTELINIPDIEDRRKTPPVRKKDNNKLEG